MAFGIGSGSDTCPGARPKTRLRSTGGRLLRSCQGKRPPARRDAVAEYFRASAENAASDVSCEILADKAVYASFEHGDFADPRHSALGYRLYDVPEGAEIADYVRSIFGS